MGTVLYWFSGAGNSLAVARDLAARLPAAQLVPVVHALEAPATEADSVGFVFPVHSFGPPAVVADLLRTFPAGPESYIFSVATCGGLPGYTHATVNRLLARRGLTHAAGWSVVMPDIFVDLIPILPICHNWLFTREKQKVVAMARVITARRRGPREDSTPGFNILGRALWGVSTRHFPQEDRKFGATDACTGCGLCRRICPVRNIRMTGGRPEWLHHCTQCYACLHWCPARAIQIRRPTVSKARYHHPEVKARDLCLWD